MTSLLDLRYAVYSTTVFMIITYFKYILVIIAIYSILTGLTKQEMQRIKNTKHDVEKRKKNLAHDSKQYFHSNRNYL